MSVTRGMKPKVEAVSSIITFKIKLIASRTKKLENPQFLILHNFIV